MSGPCVVNPVLLLELELSVDETEVVEATGSEVPVETSVELEVVVPTIVVSWGSVEVLSTVDVAVVSDGLPVVLILELKEGPVVVEVVSVVGSLLLSVVEMLVQDVSLVDSVLLSVVEILVDDVSLVDSVLLSVVGMVIVV